jgi:hypothetical protein
MRANFENVNDRDLQALAYPTKSYQRRNPQLAMWQQAAQTESTFRAMERAYYLEQWADDAALPANTIAEPAEQLI